MITILIHVQPLFKSSSENFAKIFVSPLNRGYDYQYILKSLSINKSKVNHK
ncbi:protein of unknown function [Oenococcus oeni]|uniref:Uncharacterized protein n=1 Tax=Oenococcus oeni TaxID=1247 RepID=A0AAQ2UUR0_OENOE|nr:hypothetical protein OENI_170014 [Oenococcus oeni]SYW13062.1 hypothetical protein OENI_1070008 [Oenococcus oeni]VDB97719.1 protein of unknown function [Oenococcus oeni]